MQGQDIVICMVAIFATHASHTVTRQRKLSHARHQTVAREDPEHHKPPSTMSPLDTSSSAAASATRTPIPLDPVPPYTAEETKWLEDKHGDESRFLPAHDLKLSSESDREEGRLLARHYINEPPPYTAAEKQWLQNNWRSEFYFLLAHDMSVWGMFDEKRRGGSLREN